jgi:hypothetical protein
MKLRIVERWKGMDVVFEKYGKNKIWFLKSEVIIFPYIIYIYTSLKCFMLIEFQISYLIFSF